MLLLINRWLNFWFGYLYIIISGFSFVIISLFSIIFGFSSFFIIFCSVLGFISLNLFIKFLKPSFFFISLFVLVFLFWVFSFPKRFFILSCIDPVWILISWFSDLSFSCFFSFALPLFNKSKNSLFFLLKVLLIIGFLFSLFILFDSSFFLLAFIFLRNSLFWNNLPGFGLFWLSLSFFSSFWAFWLNNFILSLKLIIFVIY